MAPYFAGVDLGTTFTAAAVARGGRPEMVSLGSARAAIPSVVLLREDGAITLGEPALQRGRSTPDRLARQFKRRIGDPTPIVLGGTPMAAHRLLRALLRWTLDRVAEREGGPPAAVAVTHPANWNRFKLDFLDQAIDYANVENAVTVSEPEAAAVHYASLTRVPPGSLVAVYDLGGGTFDAAVLRKTAGGFEIAGEPHGVEQLGGIDFDEVIFAHVADHLDGALDGLDRDDAGTVAAVQQLRDGCVAAKHALSTDLDATVPVVLPTVQTQVRITRREFERAIRPVLADTIDSLRRALRSAGVDAADLTKVLLVGGSSRIPLVSQMVSEEIGADVAVDADPKNAVALGAALVAEPAGAATAPPPEEHAPPRRDRRGALLAGGAVAAVLLAVVGFLFLRGGDDTPTTPTPAPAGQADDVGGGVTDTPAVPDTSTTTTRGPPPADEARIFVAADGSGDVATLAEAFDEVASGGTITLGTGTFDAGDGIAVGKEVTLVGAGADATEIVASSGSFALSFTGPGEFALRDVAIAYEGGGDADVVVVESAVVDFSNCAFTGGVGPAPDAGTGLVLGGDSAGSVRDCRATGNAANGFLLRDRASVDLTDNLATENGVAGLAYLDEAGGTATSNSVTGNAENGIEVIGSAAPTLDSNTASANTQAGILYADSGGGTATANQVNSNGFSGVLVNGAATPVLQGNTISRNAENGIRYGDNAAGSAVMNEVADNELNGIAVAGAARPVLDGNTVRFNVGSGILYLDQAGGSAQRNVVTGNNVGITVTDGSSPSLGGNDVSDNFAQDLDDQRFALRGDGLGVATFGQDAETALNAVEAVLGPASFDDGFQSTANGFEICLGTQIRFVTFGESLFLTFSDAATPFNDAGDAHFVAWAAAQPTDFEDVAGVGPGDRFRDLTAAHPFFEQFFDELRGSTIVRVGDAGGGEITYAFDVTDESGVLPGSVITDMSAGVNVCGE